MLFKFYTDEAAELSCLQDMFHGWSGVTVEERARQYGIPAHIARKSEGTKRRNAALAAFLKAGYQTYGKELKQSLSFHRAFWKKDSPAYLARLEKIFGHKLPPYRVRLNLQCDGISDWHGTDISINAFLYLRPHKSGHWESLLWELILSLTFQDIRKKVSPAELSDNQVWGISELTAVCVIQIAFQDDKTDWSIGYPELEPRRAEIKALFRARKDFDDYLDKTISCFRDAPLRQGCCA